MTDEVSPLSFASCVLKGRRFKVSPTLVVGLLFFAGLCWHLSHVPFPTHKNPIRFYSTEKRDDLKQLLIRAIQEAKTSITLHSYAITDQEILLALKKAKAEIHLYYDGKATPPLNEWENDHLHLHPIYGKGLMHEKIWIFDEIRVFLGSTNLTTTSLTMHDNMMVGLHAPTLAKKLLQGEPLDETFCLGNSKIRYLSLPSPEKGLQMILDALERAEKRVHLSLFTFTHPQIASKLIELKRRGVVVSVRLDQTTARGASRKIYEALLKEGVKVKTSQGFQLHHHKWAQIDESTHLLGSANWTAAALSKNRDFIILITNV